MDISVQIKTIIFSFLYGVFFSFVLGVNYRYVVGSKKIFSIILTFVFVLVNVLLYFIILKKVNGGIFHQYEVLLVVCGFLCHSVFFKFLISKFKKR